MAKKILTPMRGVKIWENEKNGFTVFELHYSADPKKRDPKYIEEVRKSMPIRKFRQEYELQWDSFEGLPVFVDYQENVHGVQEEIQPQIGLPLLIGMDFGLTPALIVCQMQELQLMALREYTAVNMGAERFLHWVIPQLRVHYPSWGDKSRDFIVYIDPSGQFRKDTDESTCAQVISSFGFTRIVPGAIGWEERRKSVDYFLTRRTKQGPAFQISIPNCPVLARGFAGGYRYNDKALDIEPNKLRPLKDNHSHVQDALQGITSRLLNSKPQISVPVPSPSFSFSKGSKR